MFSLSPTFKGLYEREKTSIQYLYNSKKVNEKKDLWVAISKPFISDKAFKSGGVNKVNSEVIPLILYTGWNYAKYECIIGRNQIKENLNPFIQEAFITESKRSGNYLPDTTSTSPYSLEIEVDSIYSKGQYFVSGFVAVLIIATISHHEEKAGEALAYCRFHYRLKRGNETVLDDYVSNKSTREMLRATKRTSLKKFHEFYRANLVESLGESIKKNIEQVVKKVSAKLEVESASNGGLN